MATELLSARLVPELNCADFAASLSFYTNILGFRILYDRIESQFASIDLNGAQLMLVQKNDFWFVGPLAFPYGRGINLQIEVPDVEPIMARLSLNKTPLFRDVSDTWYRANDLETGNREFLVQDLDGYLLRFFQHLGTRPVAP